MTKLARYYFKVGLAGIVIMVLLTFVVLWLRGQLSRDRRIEVTFSDARGIKPGEVVQMAGVDIGQVEDVQLTEDNKAQLTLAIQEKFQIPQGSQFVIRPGLLGNTRTLTVVPPQGVATSFLQEGASIEGQSASGLDETMSESRELIATLKATVEDFRRGGALSMAGDAEVQRSLKASIRNTEALTRQLPALAMQTQQQLELLGRQSSRLLATFEATAQNGNQVLGSAQVVAKNTAGLTGDMRATLNENRATLRSLLESADEAASAVAGLTASVTETVGDKTLKENLRATTTNITEATNNLVAISARLDATASDLQRFTSDPRLSNDLRETIGNIRETSESVRNLAGRVEAIRFPGEKRRPDPNAPPTPPQPKPVFSNTSLLEPGFVFDSVYDTKVERLRVDGTYSLLRSQGKFYRLGISDVAGGNRLSLQFGQSNGIPATFAYRYGLIAGELGGGFDLRAGPVDLRFDLFDPNRFTVNARARAWLNESTAITAGVDSLGNGNRATLGVQIRR